MQTRARLGAVPRTAIVLVTLGLLAALLASLALGASPGPRPTLPNLLGPGRNGLIGYSVGDGGSSAGDPPQVHLMNADGSGDHVVGQGACPTWSLDGRVLAYLGGQWPSQLMVVAEGDGSSPRVLPLLGGDVDVEGPDSSPYRPPRFREPPRLSPDGTLIAWLKEVADTNPVGPINELWVFPVDGGPGVRVLDRPSDPDESYWNLAWSPDGRAIAVAIDRHLDDGSYPSSVLVVGVDGSNPRRVITRPGIDSPFVWSPDGRWLAFRGLVDGTVPASLSELWVLPESWYVIGADGRGESAILKDREAYEPRWSPDGSEIAFVTRLDDVPRESSLRLATVAVEGGVPVGEPVVGPPVDAWVWAPDGSQIVVGRVVASIETDPNRKVFAGPRPPGETRLASIAADLSGEPAPIATIQGSICGPAWQRLAP